MTLRRYCGSERPPPHVGWSRRILKGTFETLLRYGGKNLIGGEKVHWGY
jgi:hypothetical protein